MKARMLMGGVALVLLGSACTPAQIERAIADSEAKAGRVPATAGKPDCEGAVVVAEWDDPLDCDVNPPQRLDVAYPGSDGIEQEQFQDRCDHSGGTLVWDGGSDGMFVCQGIDY